MSSYLQPAQILGAGSATVGSVGVVDTTAGVNARVDVFHNLNVSIRTVLVNNQFTPVLDANAWSTALAGSGTALTTTGAMVLRTGTTANSSAGFTSTHRARLVAGTTNLFSIAVTSTHAAGVANNVQRFGCYQLSGGDGVFVQTTGTTFQVGYRVNGSTTLGGFNVATPASLLGTWEIGYAQGGFVIWKDGLLVHASGLVPIVFVNPNFFISSECVNSGGSTTDVSLSILGTAIARMGEAEARPRFININTNGTYVIKQGPCTLHSIILGKLGGGGNVVTVYDNTAGSGTVVSALDTTGGGSAGTTIEYNLDMDNGITVVVATGTAADLTVVFS